jgi:phage terminase large subunit-like protein
MARRKVRKFLRFVFNEERANRAVRFIETCCVLSKGKDAGKTLKLRPWQKQIVRELFGWIDPKTGLRRYRKCFIFLPRKNGKSHLASAIALYMLYADGESGADVILAANSREQASIVFNAAAGMVRQSPALQPLSDVIPSTKRIAVQSTSSVLKAVSADAPTAFGLDISALIYDEIAFAPNRDLYDALTTASGSRLEPLQLFITTAGWDHLGIGYHLYQYAKTVLADPGIDPTFLPIIFEVDEKADWTKIANVRKANPAFGDFLNEDEIRNALRLAINQPSEAAKFRMLHCNQWVTAAESALDAAKWRTLEDAAVTDERLREADLFLGLDLSSNKDVTALSALWRFKDGGYYTKQYLFLPDADLRGRVLRDHAPWDGWEQSGYVFLTPGATIDYAFIRKTIDSISERFTVKAIGYDRALAHKLITELEASGFLCVVVRQGHETLGAPTKEFESLILSGKILNDGNECMSWMIGNVVFRTNANMEVCPDKQRSRQKIDGVAACINALSVAMKTPDGKPKPKPTFRMTVLG